MFEQIYTTPRRTLRGRWLEWNAVRITIVPTGKEFPDDRPWLADVLGETKTNVSADSSRRVQVQVVEGLLRLLSPRGVAVAAEVTPSYSDGLGRPNLTLQTQPDEGFYGWGEWFNAFRRESGKLDLRIKESPSVFQHKQTYSALPYFLSSQGYGLFLLNSHASQWVIDPERHQMRLRADGPPLDFLFIYGPSFKQIISTYTALTGRPPLPPRWAFGLWVTSYPQDHQDQVTAHAAEHRKRGLPLDAVILDYHWEDRFHNFQWRKKLIPEPGRLISELKEAGMRLGLILTPFVNNRNVPLQKLALQVYARDIPPGMVFADDRAVPEYREARSRAYFAHNQASWWFGGGGMLDFTNPAAARWWNDHLKPLYDQGVDFFKNDDGEYLPDSAKTALGISGKEYHNLYGFYYGKAMYEGMESLDDRRAMIYARSVWVGSQRFPAVFMGDQKPTFECMRRTLRSGLNLSLAGFSYWTADVFGLDGKTTPETHLRYAQWALLNPIARYFWRPPRVDPTRFPWSWGDLSENNFRTYSELRYRLLPYYYSLAWEAWLTGLPIMRPLLLEFPQDADLWYIYDQVMLGPALMLAPVVEEGADDRKVLLPPGVWHDWWSTQSEEGPGAVEYPAPPDKMPILVRGGSIIPMGPVLQHIPDEHRFSELELHAWPPYPAACILYDDDGCTRAYQRGRFAKTQVKVDMEEKTFAVHIGAAQGDFDGMPVRRTFKVVLHRADRPEQVQAEGGDLERWEYDVARKETRIEINLGIEQPTVIRIS
jgi:alpha-glucosidase (family GH31 glycosyl hydrolase)